MRVHERDNFQRRQNQAYSNPCNWSSSTVIKVSTRFRHVIRYTKILEILRNLQAKRNIYQPLKILEPGCGPGYFSTILSVIGKVDSFDYSEEAIKYAVNLNKSENINFFQADGMDPGSISEIGIKKYDFILLREFHPLSRNIRNGDRPLDIIGKYYNLLEKNGVMIIEHALPLLTWRKDDFIFQTSKILKKFNGMVLDALILDFIFYFTRMIDLKSMKVVYYCSYALSPFLKVISFIFGLGILKTIIIVKKDEYSRKTVE